MKIKISPFAEQDLKESITYYNEQSENLGDQFFEIINSVFSRIKDNPGQFPKSYKEMRKAKTERFPFNVYFVEKETTGYILGIFHSSRNPKVMKTRYKKS